MPRVRHWALAKVACEKRRLLLLERESRPFATGSTGRISIRADPPAFAGE